MRTIKKLATICLQAFGPIVMVGGVLITVIATIADVNGSAGGSTAIFSLTWDQLYKLAVVMASVGGALTILRHEWELHEVKNLSGNEYAQGLWKEGIPPTLDTYLRYVASGDFGIMNRFWKAGIFGGKDTQGRTDLHLACLYGHPAIAQELMKKGADPTEATSEGHTALLMAALGGHVRLIDILFDHKCAPEAGTLSGCSAMYAAASKGHESAVEKLIALGVSLDRADNANLTPLMVAISQRHHGAARALLKAGADIGRRDALGATLMDYAKTFQAPPDIVDLLEAKGIKVSDHNLVSRQQGASWDGSVRIGWEKATDAELANV